MATELHLARNSTHGIKRHLRELKASNNNHEQLLRAVIDSNIHTQQAVAEVSRSINEFVALLKSVGAEEEIIKESAKAPIVVNNKISIVEQKLDKIAQQNLQLIEVISDLVRHLKNEKPRASMPPSPPTYPGMYPMRPLR